MIPRVVVTGVGCVSALGHDAASTWEGIKSGRCGIAVATLFDTSAHRTHLAAQAWGFDPVARAGRREAHRSSRADQLAVAAAEEALGDARFPSSARGGLALVLGGGAGGMRDAERFHRALLGGDRRSARRGTRALTSHPPNATTDFLARRFEIHGPRATISTACSSSATAVGYAADLVRSGRVTAALCGGAEALCELTYAGFNSLRAVDPSPCRPFDARRAGLSLGECGAILLLESAESAALRGARVYAEVAGYAISADAHHMTAPDPLGAGAARAIRGALHDAGLTPSDIDYVNAHGTGTPQNDAAETAALHASLGARAAQIAVSSTKSQVGHCLGAAGAIEAAVTVMAIRHGLLPATIGWESRDAACDLDYVPTAPRPARIRAALSDSFAFGGNNTVLAFRAA